MFTHPLQDQKYGRGVTSISDKVRTFRTNGIGHTDRQADFFFRLARKYKYRFIDDIECVLGFRVVMPRYRLGRTNLNLGDAETGPSSVLGATFNFIRQVGGV